MMAQSAAVKAFIAALTADSAATESYQLFTKLCRLKKYELLELSTFLMISNVKKSFTKNVITGYIVQYIVEMFKSESDIKHKMKEFEEKQKVRQYELEKLKLRNLKFEAEVKERKLKLENELAKNMHDLEAKSKDLVKSIDETPSDILSVGPESSDLLREEFLPFVSEGVVSPSESLAPTPIRILRVTGASQSLLLSEALSSHDTEVTATGDFVFVQGVGGICSVPLHVVYLKSGLVTGLVRVGLVSSLPFKGVSLMLGNDLAGEKIFPSVQLPSNPSTVDESNVDSEIFPACAVTRSLAQMAQEEEDRVQRRTQTKFLSKNSVRSDPPIDLDLSTTFIGRTLAQNAKQNYLCTDFDLADTFIVQALYNEGQSCLFNSCQKNMDSYDEGLSSLEANVNITVSDHQRTYESDSVYLQNIPQSFACPEDKIFNSLIDEDLFCKPKDLVIVIEQKDQSHFERNDTKLDTCNLNCIIVTVKSKSSNITLVSMLKLFKKFLDIIMHVIDINIMMNVLLSNITLQKLFVTNCLDGID